MKNLIAGMIFLVGMGLFAQESASNGAYIREFTGTVEVKAPDAVTWRAARTGERISQDTIISTSFRSTAFIALGNSTLIVRPLTRLSLEELQNVQGNESVRLNLHTGRVRAEVSPPAGGKTDFTVQSPIATASVRGTAFDFDGVNLSVDEGRVLVTGKDGIGVYVGAGHESVSDPETGETAWDTALIRAELTLAQAAEGRAGSAPKPIIPEADIGFYFTWPQ